MKAKLFRLAIVLTLIVSLFAFSAALPAMAATVGDTVVMGIALIAPVATGSATPLFVTLVALITVIVPLFIGQRLRQRRHQHRRPQQHVTRTGRIAIYRMALRRCGSWASSIAGSLYGVLPESAPGKKIIACGSLVNRVYTFVNFRYSHLLRGTIVQKMRAYGSLISAGRISAQTDVHADTLAIATQPPTDDYFEDALIMAGLKEFLQEEQHKPTAPDATLRRQTFPKRDMVALASAAA